MQQETGSSLVREMAVRCQAITRTSVGLLSITQIQIQWRSSTTIAIQRYIIQNVCRPQWVNKYVPWLHTKPGDVKIGHYISQLTHRSIIRLFSNEKKWTLFWNALFGIIRIRFLSLDAHVKILAKERRCYKCSIFSHWLRSYSTVDGKRDQAITIYIYS